jgi:hypothetical protein
LAKALASAPKGGRHDERMSAALLLDRWAGRFADPDLNRDAAVG